MRFRLPICLLTLAPVLLAGCATSSAARHLPEDNAEFMARREDFIRQRSADFVHHGMAQAVAVERASEEWFWESWNAGGTSSLAQAEERKAQAQFQEDLIHSLRTTR